MSSYSKNLEDKLKAAKNVVKGPLAEDESKALIPISPQPQGGLPTSQNRLEVLKNIAADVLQTLSPADLNAINNVSRSIDSSTVGSPMGVEAFFKRLGTQARDKYNKARSEEVDSFNQLQRKRTETITSQVNSAHQLAHLTDDLAIQQLLKEMLQQLSIVQAVGQQHVWQEAFKAGWSNLAAHEDVKKQRELSQIKMDARDREFDQDIRRAEAMKRVDSEDEVRRTRGHIVLVTEASMDLRQKEKTLRQELMEVRRRRHEVETGKDPAALKRDLLADFDDEIASLQEQINGLKKHYREAGFG